MSLLELRGLGGGYGQVEVLRDLNLTVDEGEVVVILGANGAGKTTTLRAISGLLDRVSGDVFFDASAITNKAAQAIAQAGISHVPQGRGTFGDLTVDENLRIGAITRKDGGVESDLARWYEMFPRLAERRTQAAGSMSGGEQQMLAIARALMARPRILLLDEPSLGLAPLITKEVFERLGEINKEDGLAMLVVEQNASLALAIADRGCVLETGSIVASGPASQLMADETVRKAYLGF
ncbi:MAG: ABC transporter ATP-binding protein [Microthrixaceae bacterium]|nr:ABC transporter ATP-binding protein [Acidimicrobiales bacterium]MCB9402836.1 ABC transporter ATP-binding protein [Microthrixaceae bacterium]